MSVVSYKSAHAVILTSAPFANLLCRLRLRRHFVRKRIVVFVHRS